MYRNYIFDFYGTLADIRTDEEDPGLWEKMSGIYTALGASYPAEELRRAFRRLEEEEVKRLAREQRMEPGFGQRNSKEPEIPETGIVEPDLTKVFALLYHEKNVSCDADRARMTAVTFRTLSRQYLRVYEGVEELLDELGKRGKRVYLLSNAQADFTRPEIGMLGLTRYFDGIVLSSEQGCKKPSPIFFRRLLEQYRLDPAESIMIGNDEAADIAGARSVGMDTLYIHTDISPQVYGKVPATYRVMDGDFRKAARILLNADTGN